MQVKTPNAREVLTSHPIAYIGTSVAAPSPSVSFSYTVTSNPDAMTTFALSVPELTREIRRLDELSKAGNATATHNLGVLRKGAEQALTAMTWRRPSRSAAWGT